VTMPFEASIVRLRSADGSIVGAGFLVADRQVLTCTHVVSDALGIPSDTEQPPAGTLHLDFPLIAPGDSYTARIVLWQLEDDIAGLELTNDRPAEAKPARFVDADDWWEHPFRAFGFPKGYDDGIWASGLLRGKQANGWVQIEDVKQTGYFVQPGFSGGLVWDDALEGVAGMIVATDTDESVRTAFIIPIEVLVRAWPTVLGQALLEADMDRLRASRDQADQRRREMRERQRVVNLRPLDVTHTFKDRLCEMRDLYDYLADSSVRLVSVVGRGGMGKTALVSRVLVDLERGMLRLPDGEKELSVDGILYLSARSTGLSLERIYADIGRMLGEPVTSKLAACWADRDMSLSAKVEYLLETLQDELYLVLLDNLEDYLTEDGEVAEEGLHLFIERCLTQPSGVRLVVTSRERVKIAAAALVRARTIPLYEGLPKEEAVALLRDLDPQGELGLRGAIEKDLHTAVQLTQGIPRALELLAGILDRGPTVSLPRLLADEDLFGEQVVEGLVAEGYRRLRGEEPRVMEALAVFDRPVEETAVVYLLHPWLPGLDVRFSLRRLVSSYFVSANRATGKYSLHPLDREYAYRQLLDPPEDGVDTNAYTRCNLELRAADFYASIRKSESEWKNIDDLEPQLSEFEHRVRGKDFDGACRVLNQIDFDYLYPWGHYNQLLTLRKKIKERVRDPKLRAVHLRNLGIVHYALEEFEESVQFHQQALSAARQINDLAEEARNVGQLGFIYRVLGQFEHAIKSYEEALSIARKVGDHREEARWLLNLGIAHRAQGQFGQSLQFYEKALIANRKIDSPRADFLKSTQKSTILGNLGQVYQALGQFTKANRFHQEALVIAQRTGYRRNEVIWLNNLGLSFYLVGKLNHALAAFDEALSIAREIKFRRGESYQLIGLGKTLLTIDLLSEAQAYCEEALALDVQENSYQAALVLGIILLHHQNLAASNIFEDVAGRCQIILDKTESLYEARYALAAALVGQAVCDPRWLEPNKRIELLAPALAEYRQALKITSAMGVVQDALRDLELIRSAGIEGVEPVFELLEGTKAKNEY
jgi:tetratricopeptide (TPR) repeat protein